MAHQINFDELKSQISVADCAQWLGIKLKANRGDCPLCGHDRTFTITPDKRMFGCHACKTRGSVIDMVFHVKQCGSIRDAALLLQQHFMGTSTVSTSVERTVPVTTPKRQDDGELKPLDYLDAKHDIVPALGLTPEVCQALGWGYANKGTMRGRFLIALRRDDGKLVGYLGIATKEEMIPLLHFPANLPQMLEQPAKPQEESDTKFGFLRVVK